MNPDEKGGPAEFLPYLLMVAAVALALFVGVKYFQRGEKAPRTRALSGPRRAQRKVSRKPRALSAPKRGDRLRSLSVSEPPSPGAPPAADFAERIETASHSRTMARRAGTPTAKGTVFNPGASGSAVSGSVSTVANGERKGARSVRQEKSREGSKASRKRRRGEEGGRSAYAGTAGGGGRYGVGGATVPGSEESEKGSGETMRRMSVDGSAGASGALSAAKKLSVGESLEGASVEEPGDPVLNAVLGQLAVDHSVIGKLRDKAEEIRSEGRPVTREELREEVAAVMNSRGLSEDSVEADKLVERALLPEPPLPLALVSDRARELLSNPENRPTESEREEIVDRAEAPPPKPAGPPPKGAVEAYVRHRATFDWIEQNLGVKAHHVLGILWTETRLGKITGKHPVVKTFTAFAEGGKGWRKRAAPKELAALSELEAKGALGTHEAGSVRGSWAGALGTWQCMPTSCLAYGRGRGGGSPDPFDFEDAAVSAANYLKRHGYAQSPSKAFYGYNHSQEYVNTVNANSNKLEPWIDKLR